MVSSTEILSLTELDYLPYLNDQGLLSEEFQKAIGVYAIFDKNKTLNFVNYSRDIYLSLKQHLVRKPESCYWLKIKTISRPSRTILESIKQAWITENGEIPIGNSQEKEQWTQAINVKILMTKEEKEVYEQGDELSKTKTLKKISRRIEANLQEALKNRGSNVEIRFNPKLKEQGLLNLK